RLAAANPDWGPTLSFTSPFELLVATILAAQAQDERINQVTRTLFRKYRGPSDYAAARKGVLERDIKATGFFNQKAKALRAMSSGLLEEFGGEVPSDMESLTRLHGVGRKTASIVLGAAFGVPAIAVDRHVARVAERLGLARREQHRVAPDDRDAVGERAVAAADRRRDDPDPLEHDVAPGHEGAVVQRADFGPFSGQIGPTCDTNYRSSDTEDRRDRKRR